MKLSILGPPGSGKTTQAVQLCAIFSLTHIYPGELLRSESGTGSVLGRRIKSSLDSGSLVPTEIVMALIQQRIAEISDGYVLDGFPRTMEQASEFEFLMHERKEELDAVIDIDLPEAEVVRRLLSRARADDTPDLIRERICVYHTETDEVLSFYSDSRLLIRVPGSGTVDQVTERILHGLKILYQKRHSPAQTHSRST